MPSFYFSKKLMSVLPASFVVTGQDKKGVLAKVALCLYQNNANILEVDHRVRGNFLTIRLRADVADSNFTQLKKELAQVAQEIGMEIRVNLENQKTQKRFAILVTHETHCLKELLQKFCHKKNNASPAVVIGNYPDLKPLAQKAQLPFHLIAEKDRLKAEEQIDALLKKYDVDFLVLARWMRILSPEFVSRYEGRIINIHPSLLPAFPGARPYQQALDTGVTVVGVTAHFVTTDLDRGPVILQDAFKIGKKDSLELIRTRGQKLEAQVLSRAVALYAKDKLYLHWGKVYFR
jgi:formyltetrahydrofolate deformylase